jgi:hypothetical protein
MAITQERMIALLNEMEDILAKIEIVKRTCNQENENPLSWEIANTLNTIQLACYWIETAHFKKNAKANMHRAMKHREQRGSKSTRPLLGMRIQANPREANEQVIAETLKIAQVVETQFDKDMDQAKLEAQKEAQKHFAELYKMLSEAEPTWDAVKLTKETEYLIQEEETLKTQAMFEKMKAYENATGQEKPSEKISDGNLQLPQKLPDGRVQVF